MSPGPHPGGLCIIACTEADPLWTATTMGSTHPTGMHSCCSRKHSSRMPTIRCSDHHGGGGCTCPGGVSTRRCTCPCGGGCTCLGVYLPRGFTCQGVPRGVYLPGCVPVGGVPASVHAGIHTPRADTLPGQTHIPLGRHPPPPGGHCSGRYASYWNAFLFYMRLSISLLIVG